MSSSAETEQEAGVTEQGERDGCKSLSQELVAGRKGMAGLWGAGVTRDLGLLAGVARVPRVPRVENFLRAGQVLIRLLWDTCQGKEDTAYPITKPAHAALISWEWRLLLG